LDQSGLEPWRAQKKQNQQSSLSLLLSRHDPERSKEREKKKKRMGYLWSKKKKRVENDEVDGKAKKGATSRGPAHFLSRSA
jgi:hypothetical protein